MSSSYQAVKQLRKVGEKVPADVIAAAITQQEEAVKAASLAFARATADVVATQKLSPFPSEEEGKAALQALAEFQHAAQRLSKLYYWQKAQGA